MIARKKDAGVYLSQHWRAIHRKLAGKSRWFGLALFVWLALAVFPVPPSGIGVGLDASWGYGLNIAHAKHLVFGKDIIFTFGPLGYLSCPDPDLAEPALVFAFSWSTYLIFLYALFRCLRAIGSWVSAIVTAGVLCVAVLLTYSPVDRVQMCFLALAIAIVANVGRPRMLEFVLAGFIAGELMLIKLNGGITAWAVFYSLLAWQVWTARRKGLGVPTRIYFQALIPPLVVLIGITLLQGNPTSVFPYLRGSWDILSGYSEAMGQPGPAWQFGLSLLGIAALAIVTTWLAEHPRSFLKGMGPALITVFFAFKHAMVRQDSGHADTFHIQLAAASLFLLVCAQSLRDRRMLASFAGFNVCLALFIMVEPSPALLDWAGRRAALMTLKDSAMAFAQYGLTWDRIRNENLRQLETLQLDESIRRAIGGGPVDSVPFRIDLIKANGWELQPRPVFQSYCAFTPWLDRINADHLGSRRSAEHILLQWDSIDGRHPFLDDARSWRSLLNHYDVEITQPNLFLLRRRAGPRYSDPVPMGSVLSGFNENIPVPTVSPREFLIMRASIDKTIWGSVRGALWRVHPIYLEATYASGRTARARVTRANLIGGAFVSQLPQDLKGVLPYFGQLEPGLPDQLASIQWSTSGPAQFSGKIRISWSRVSFRAGESGSEMPQRAPVLPLTTLWKPSERASYSLVGADAAVSASSLLIRPNNLDPRVILDCGQSLNRYKLIVLRARFSAGDRVDLFFGRHSYGRGVEGYVPASNRWLDIYVNVASNPYWQAEAGSILRFDPSSDRSMGARIELAGVWGATESPFSDDQKMIFYPSPEVSSAHAGN